MLILSSLSGFELSSDTVEYVRPVFKYISENLSLKALDIWFRIWRKSRGLLLVSKTCSRVLIFLWTNKFHYYLKRLYTIRRDSKLAYCVTADPKNKRNLTQKLTF